MSSTHGLLQPNQPGYYYIVLEESYVTLFKISADVWYKDHKHELDAEKSWKARHAHAVAKAYITDVLVNLSNDLYKQLKSEKKLWVFLSFPQLEIRLHDACKMRILKDAMKEMIEDGYVFKRPNRNPRYKSLEYRLHLQKYREELAALPKKKDKEEGDDDSADLHDASSENDSADLHDEIDSAKTHDDSADLHEHDADLHDDSADTHPIRNRDLTKTKQNTKQERESAASSISENDTNNPSLFKNIDKEILISPETTALMDHWDNTCGYLVPRDKKHIDAAKELVRCGATKDDLLEMQKFCLRINPTWYNENGVDLAAIERNWGKWRSLGSPKAEPEQQVEQDKQPTTSIENFVIPETPSLVLTQLPSFLVKKVRLLADRSGCSQEDLDAILSDLDQLYLFTLKNNMDLATFRFMFDECLTLAMGLTYDQVKNMGKVDYLDVFLEKIYAKAVAYKAQSASIVVESIVL